MPVEIRTGAPIGQGAERFAPFSYRLPKDVDPHHFAEELVKIKNDVVLEASNPDRPKKHVKGIADCDDQPVPMS